MLMLALLSALASQEAPPLAAPTPVAPAAPLRWVVPPRVETPPKALQHQVNGAATVRCAFTDGAPSGCQIVAETPPGYGFGMAVLRGARTARAESGINGPREFTLNFQVR